MTWPVIKSVAPVPATQCEPRTAACRRRRRCLCCLYFRHTKMSTKAQKPKPKRDSGPQARQQEQRQRRSSKAPLGTGRSSICRLQIIKYNSSLSSVATCHHPPAAPLSLSHSISASLSPSLGSCVCLPSASFSAILYQKSRTHFSLFPNTEKNNEYNL